MSTYGAVHLALHLLGIGYEVRRQVTAVELHTLDNANCGITALGLLDCDDTVLCNLTHSIGNELANLAVVVGRNCGNLLNLVIVVAHSLALLLD